MLVAAIAAYRVWQAEGGATPHFVAGHSLGEYSALVASGALSLADAVPLVRFRAQAMQEAVAVGSGAMAAVLGLDAVKVVEICNQVQSSFAAGSGEVVPPISTTPAKPSSPAAKPPWLWPASNSKQQGPNAPCHCPCLRHFTAPSCSRPPSVCAAS
jgi:hypothetical protein